MAALTASPASARAGWERPSRLAKPVRLDIAPPQLAISPSATAAVSYAVQDEDNPAHSSAFLVMRTSRGRRSGPKRVSSAQEVLDLAYDGPALELLTGNSSSNNACCSSAAVRRQRGGGFTRSQTLSKDLAGATAGRLVPLPGGMLAAVATERGVWGSQAPHGGRFGPVHALSGGGAQPEAMQAIAAPNGGGVIAWTETDRRSGSGGPRRIFVASGSATGAPAHAHALLSVPRGHRIDELGLAGPSVAGSSAPATAAWIESWFDSHGNYRSEVVVADLAHPSGRKRFAVAGTIASGLSFVSDAAGSEVAAWRTCTWRNSCDVEATVRRAGKRFGRVQSLAPVDAAELPAAAMAPSGSGLIGWVQEGHVLAASLGARASQFSRSQTVSRTVYASDIAISFASRGQAFAAWSQGTLAPVVMGAVYRP